MARFNARPAPLRDSRGRYLKGGGNTLARGKVTVTDIDHGWKSMQAQLLAARNASTKIGIQAGTTRKPEAGESGETDMVAIAAWNEFGTEDKNGNTHIPPRPAHAQAFDQNRQQMNRNVDAAYNQFLEGRWTLREAIGKVGERFQFLLQKQIRNFSDPSNAPSTIERKGVDNPLQNHDQLLNSVRHVEEGV